MAITKLHNWSPKRILIKKINELIDGGTGGGTTDAAAIARAIEVLPEADKLGSAALKQNTLPAVSDPNKVIRYMTDFVGLAPVAPFANVATASGTMAPLSENDPKHPVSGVFKSSTTANSGYSVGVAVSMLPYNVKPVLTVHFKLPVTVNANTVSLIGNSNVLTGADRCGIQITGTTAKVLNIVGGVTTASGPDWSLTANTWYIARCKFESDNSATFSIYTENGTLLHTYTASVALYTHATNGQLCARSHNTGTTAVDMLIVDMMELYLKATGRYYLPHD